MHFKIQHHKTINPGKLTQLPIENCFFLFVISEVDLRMPKEPLSERGFAAGQKLSETYSKTDVSAAI